MSNYPLKEFYKSIYKRYDLVNKIFTFGLDKRWRIHASKVLLNDNPQKILDLCCGTGVFTNEIAHQANPDCKITGYDFSAQMLKVANKLKQEKGHDNIEFIEGDAANMPFEKESFDAIGIAFGFRNLTYNSIKENQHITEIFRVLKTGGRLYILESGSPGNVVIRFFYTMFLFIFLVPIGGILTGDFKAYYYLAVSSRHYYSRRQMSLLLKCFGFNFVSVKKFLFGATNLYVASK